MSIADFRLIVNHRVECKLALAEGQQLSRVRFFLEELSEDQQEVIRLKFQEEMSYAEIAREQIKDCRPREA